jgi:hypothetical protein
MAADQPIHQLDFGGGVTRSLALDAHGKGLSSALLDYIVAHEISASRRFRSEAG